MDASQAARDVETLAVVIVQALVKITVRINAVVHVIILVQDAPRLALVNVLISVVQPVTLHALLDAIRDVREHAKHYALQPVWVLVQINVLDAHHLAPQTAHYHALDRVPLIP